MAQAVRNIVREGLKNIRGARELVSLSLRATPYSQNYPHLQTLHSQLQNHETQAQKLLLQKKSQPQILTCEPFLNFAYLGSTLLNEDFASDTLILRLARSQQWANNCIRELNQLGLQELELRQVLIEFRNALEAYMQGKQIKGRVARTLKEIL